MRKSRTEFFRWGSSLILTALVLATTSAALLALLPAQAQPALQPADDAPTAEPTPRIDLEEEPREPLADPQRPETMDDADEARPLTEPLPPAPDGSDTPGKDSPPMNEEAAEAPSPLETSPNEDLARLVETGVFPEYALTQELPVERAQFAEVIINLLRHNRNYVSNFPFYRDVPLTHPQYRQIEILRERKLIPNNHSFTPAGFFFPDQPVTNGEAYRVFGRALAGITPSPETSDLILKPFDGTDDLPLPIRPVVAKLINARIIPVKSFPDQILAVDEFLYFPVLAEMSARLAAITSGQRFALPVDEEAFPALPEGVSLQIVPNSALFKSRMAVGDQVFFSTTEDVPGVPRGSRVSGTVTERLDENRFILTFTSVKTIDGDFYRSRATLTLSFEAGEDAFIVPGVEPYTIVTDIPAE